MPDAGPATRKDCMRITRGTWREASLQRSYGLRRGGRRAAPALRTVANRLAAELPFKSTSTRCRRRVAWAPRSCTGSASEGETVTAPRFLFSTGARPRRVPRCVGAVIAKPAGAQLINAYVANAYEPVVRSGPAAPRNCAASATSERVYAPVSGGRSTRGICLMTDGDQIGALVEGCYRDITPQAR